MTDDRQAAVVLDLCRRIRIADDGIAAVREQLDEVADTLLRVKGEPPRTLRERLTVLSMTLSGNIARRDQLVADLAALTTVAETVPVRVLCSLNPPHGTSEGTQ